MITEIPYSSLLIRPLNEKGDLNISVVLSASQITHKELNKAIGGFIYVNEWWSDPFTNFNTMKIPSVAILLLLSFSATAQVSTLTRNNDPVILTGADLP